MTAAAAKADFINVGPNLGVFTQAGGGGGACSPTVIQSTGLYHGNTASSFTEKLSNVQANSMFVFIDVMNKSAVPAVTMAGVKFSSVAFRTNGGGPTTVSLWVSTGGTSATGVVIATTNHTTSVDSGSYLLELGGMDISNGLSVVVATFTGTSAGASTSFVSNTYTSTYTSTIMIMGYGNEQDSTSAHTATGPGPAGSYTKAIELLSNTSALFTKVDTASFSVQTSTVNWTGSSTDGVGVGVILRASCLQ